MTENKKYLDDLKSELNKYTKKLSEIQAHFKGKAGKDFEKIFQALGDVLHEAGDSYTRLKSASFDEWEPMKKIATKAFKELKTSFDTFLSTSSEQIKIQAGKIEGYAEEQLECVAGYVRKNPIKSVLLAAGLGFLMGRILK